MVDMVVNRSDGIDLPYYWLFDLFYYCLANFFFRLILLR